MYTRTKTWQNGIIESKVQSEWENTITFDYPCIDIRFNLEGYGWKANSDDENLTVLYEGRYDLYYRQVGDLNWEYFTTVISERAGYNDDTVYKSTFVQLGVVHELIYEVKIIASDAEKFTNWGGTLEGITDSSQFWTNCWIRATRPFTTIQKESLSITENVFMSIDEWDINVYELVSVGSTVRNLLILDWFSNIYDELSVLEYPILSLSWGVDVNDTLTVAEDLTLTLSTLSFSVYETLEEVLEAPMGHEPTININPYPLSPPLDHTLVFEDVDLFDEFDIATVYDSISITEFINPQDIVIELGIVYEDITIVEDAELTVILNVTVYNAVSVTEDINFLRIYVIEGWDTISIIENINIFTDPQLNVYDELLVEENITINGVSNIDVYDELLVEENVTVHDIVIELGIVYEDITIVEDVLIVPDPVFEVYETLSGTVYDTDWKLMLHMNNDSVDASSYNITPDTDTPANVNVGKFDNYSKNFKNVDSDEIEYAGIVNASRYNICSEKVGAYTIDFWVLMSDTVAASGGLISNYLGNNGQQQAWYIIWNGTDENLRIYLWGANGLGGAASANGTTITQSVWHHIAWVRKGIEHGVYLDGVQVLYDSWDDYSIEKSRWSKYENF